MAGFEAPQAAYHAAAAVTDESRARLAAAAPFIAAAALRQAAEEMWERSDGLSQVYSARLRMRADQLDGRQPSQDTREGILAAAGLTEADMPQRPTVHVDVSDWDSPEDAVYDGMPADPHSCRSIPVPTTDAETARLAELLAEGGPDA